MSLKKTEKEALVGLSMLLVSIFIISSIFMIRDRSTMLLSPRLVPLIVAVFMILISLIYFLKNSVKGLPSAKTWFESVKECMKKSENRSIVWGILTVAVYIFLGLPLIGYYISSAVLVTFILIYFVRKTHLIISILSGIAISIGLYVLFGVVLHLPLR